MSLLINLLPDLRQAKLRDKRRRQLASGVAVLVWSVCGGVIVLMLIVWGGQKAIIATTSSSISKKVTELKAIPNLTEALTAQEHLAALSGLYDKRVYLSKFFTAYEGANPTDVALSTLKLDESNVLKISGSAKSYAAIAKLARALEQSNQIVGSDGLISGQPYFTDVLIGGASAESSGTIGFSIELVVGTGVLTNGN